MMPVTPATSVNKRACEIAFWPVVASSTSRTSCGASASPLPITRTKAVVRDTSLETGNPATIYLFNGKRNAFVEYHLSIVQQKLRELSEDERQMVKQLRKAFDAARPGFTPRRAARPRLQRVKPREIDDDFELEEGDIDPADDDMLLSFDGDNFPPDGDEPDSRPTA